MTWQIPVILFSAGLVLVVFSSRYGLLAVMMMAVGVIGAYGYPTSGWFLPSDFYLIAVHGNSVWLEEREHATPRAVALREVPEEWRKALEESKGQPVRIARSSEGGSWFEDGSGWLSPQVGDLRVIGEYRMTKIP